MSHQQKNIQLNHDLHDCTVHFKHNVPCQKFSILTPSKLNSKMHYINQAKAESSNAIRGNLMTIINLKHLFTCVL